MIKISKYLMGDEVDKTPHWQLSKTIDIKSNLSIC